MLDQITPLILTFNEAPNIARTLERLSWAQEILIVDSFSDDETIDIIAGFPNARVIQRRFDNHAAQSNFGLTETGISTEWVLALDADFVLTDEFIDEARALEPKQSIAGYSVPIFYCVNGRALRSSLLPALIVLYRRAAATYIQDGHAHRVVVKGETAKLRSRILHDDRKPFSRWLADQQRYMSLEAKKLTDIDRRELNSADRIRRLRVIAPAAILFYCLVLRGGVLDGRAGFYYAFQRTLAELLLSLYLLEHDFEEATKPRSRIAERQETITTRRFS